VGNKGKLPKADKRIDSLPTRMAQVEPNQWRANKTNQGSTARGYGYRWQQARKQWLLEHPLCVMCERDQSVTPAW